MMCNLCCPVSCFFPVGFWKLRAKFVGLTAVPFFEALFLASFLFSQFLFYFHVFISALIYSNLCFICQVAF